jgi:diguanylate cyclase (GGDEF)-like protein
VQRVTNQIATAIPLEGKIVCVVDDDDIYRQYLATLLKSNALQVVEARNGDELLRVLGERPVDCILLDYSLEHESGLTVYDAVRERVAKAPPVVMLTANENERTIIKAFRTGVSDYVMKRGMRPAELLQAIGETMARQSDLDQRDEEVRRLRRQATFDSVTGLHTAQSLEERLERATMAAARRGGRYAVIIAAFNEFTFIDAKFGQVVGDRMLRLFATRLQQEVRASDICGRRGVDSVLCLIEGDPGDDVLARTIARFRQVLTFEVNQDAAVLSLTPSIGFAVYPDNGRTPDEVVAAAEAGAARERAAWTPSTIEIAPAPRRDPAMGAGEEQIVAAGADAAVAPAAGGAERRRERRQRVLKRGQIVVHELHSTIDCMIRDVSSAGARLRVDCYFAAPSRFELRFVETGQIRPVRLRWQRGNELGVEFLT